MSRVSVQDAEPDDAPFDDVDDFEDVADEEEDYAGEDDDGPGRPRGARGRRRRRKGDSARVEIEKEVTKRAIVDAVTRLLSIILYMAFTLVRERDAGVVALDPEDDDLGPEDDWAEA